MYALQIALAALLLSADPSGIRTDDAACRVVKEKIRHIQSRMRSGYTRAQGERMEEQLRKLKRRRKEVCR